MSSRTEDKLIAAARDMIITHGAEGASVEKICTQAGFTRGAFYSNFSSKDELYAAVAEAEYQRLIAALVQVLERWSRRAPIVRAVFPDELSGEADLQLMTQLLEEALFAMQLDADFYIVQSELLIRSVRSPAWAAMFHPINNDFVRNLAQTIEAILAAVGRRPNGDLMVITNGLIGLALRASCVSSWVASALAARGGTPRGDGPLSVMYSRPGSEILGLIVTLLYAKSAPLTAS